MKKEVDLQFSVGDEFLVSDDFANGFVVSVGNKMRGRVARVSRTFTVMPSPNNKEMIELDFLPPTSRHKKFKMSFQVEILNRRIASGELTRVEAKKKMEVM